MSELIEIESSDGKFMVRLINWLDKAEACEGSTTIRLNGASRIDRLTKAVESLETLIHCDQLHHCPSDRHGIGEPCPAEARLRERVKEAKQHPQLAKVQGSTKHKSLASPTPPKRRAVAALPLRAPERAGDVAVIPLPLPDRDLQPNRKLKVNPYKLTRLTKATREAAKFIARQVRPATPWGRVRIDVTLWGAGRLDKVSVLEYLKATIDGAAEGIGTDDRNFEPGTITKHNSVKSAGRREVELTLTRLA